MVIFLLGGWQLLFAALRITGLVLCSGTPHRAELPNRLMLSRGFLCFPGWREKLLPCFRCFSFSSVHTPITLFIFHSK
uniref:Secreted protein n=1 Tax=Myripristis murdjan TaxID=586833 RepID=A0A667X2P2_9TELE